MSDNHSVVLFCLKSVPWTGNELTGDNVENCQTFFYISPTFRLHHSCRRVFTVFYVAAMLYDRFGRALNGGTFWPPNRTFNAQKIGQGELSRR